MNNKYLEMLKQKAIDFFENENIQIFLFGSRARNNASGFADVDIGVIPKDISAQKKITLFKDEIDNMNIPYKVEVINFQDVSGDFKEHALKDAVIWKY